MKRLGLIVALPMSLVAASLAVAEPVSNNMAARIEGPRRDAVAFSKTGFSRGPKPQRLGCRPQDGALVVV